MHLRTRKEAKRISNNTKNKDTDAHTNHDENRHYGNKGNPAAVEPMYVEPFRI